MVFLGTPSRQTKALLTSNETLVCVCVLEYFVHVCGVCVNKCVCVGVCVSVCVWVYV